MVAGAGANGAAHGTETAEQLRRIAVGTDGSATAARAVATAVDLAANCGAELVVASSYRPVSESRLRRELDEAPPDMRWSVTPTEDVEAILREAEELGRARGVAVSSEARVGDPAQVLCDVARDHEVDLLVVGSKGMNRRHLPSVPNSVSHGAPCSVMIVKTA